MNFKAQSSATAIGSFPHLNAKDACDMIFETISEIPVWPQLPKKSFYEDMLNQYSRSLPCYFIDEENQKSGFNSEKELAEELEKFYSNFMEGNTDYFGLDEKHCAGFSAFIQKVKENPDHHYQALKGHITGPLTMGLATDADGKYAIYKPDLFDTIVKNCSMNAKWQIEKMKDQQSNVIIFIDEPSLSVLGSGYYSIDHESMIASFDEVIKDIKKYGGISGMHCCGNANWDEILTFDLDIVNFDAADEIVLDKLLNSKNLNAFFEKKKIIAWGIVPTVKDKLVATSYDIIENSFSKILKKLKEKGISESDVLENSLITPSCGTGTLDESLSRQALEYTKKLSDNLRKG